MTYPHRPAAPLAAGQMHRDQSGMLDDCSDGRPDRAKPLSRRYEAAHLSPSGDVVSFVRFGPALPLFEQAFNAFARGTVIATTRGQIAVEDLRPGEKILTEERGAEPLLWIGRMQFKPEMRPSSAGLVRIAAEAMGYGRPITDTLFGPGARLLDRGLLRPPSERIDGESIVPVVPRGPVVLCHLLLPGHRTIRANGIEVESFHPGPFAHRAHDPLLLTHFLRLFPHIRRLADFGPLMRERADGAEAA